MTNEAFILCFKCFTSRRGLPVRIISAKTFKAAARTVSATMMTSPIIDYMSNIGVKWSFNLEKAPWLGGVFERMIQTAKRCLRKTRENVRLTYEELLTSLR